MSTTNANLIWNIAEKLRGPFQPNQYGDVILPFAILRRLDCILEPTKDEVLAEYKKLAKTKVDPDIVLKTKFKLPFYNTSRWDFRALTSDAEDVADNLLNYIARFSPNIRDVFDGFGMEDLIERLSKSDRLYLIVKEFAAVDLHPKTVSGYEMGLIFEELIRKFAESNNAAAGDHFTPREVIALMVDVLFATADDALTKPGTVRTIYDPAAGTGGMLSTAYDHLLQMNHKARPVLYGQEINSRSYAMCKSDMIIKGQDVDNIYLGDTLTDDNFRGRHFDYLLSNPPFGVDWKTQQRAVDEEYRVRGFAGRFGPGLPRVSDGSLLFLLHLISKMEPVKQNGEGGSRLAIVLNGSPLFTGGAGSGESNIRQWIIENDLLDAIIALPTDMFYNTGISTYIWILDNNKPTERQGTVQLINGVDMFGKMRKSLGSKRKYLRDQDIQQIVQLYGEHIDDPGSDERAPVSKVFANDDFGYRTITVERPLQLVFRIDDTKIDAVLATKAVSKLADDEQEAIRKSLTYLADWEWSSRDAFINDLKDALRDNGFGKPGAPIVKTVWSTIGEHSDAGDVITDRHGNPEPDPALRDTENVPLSEDVDEYFEREVLPHVPDAWIDHDKTKIGYEIPFTRHFYRYVPPRPLGEIQKDLRHLVSEIQLMLKEVGA
ncbi:class I SAM-dependent DNA methyltransferase [Gordonia alkanivorans]|uniref:site-specific DNA-methyltransferase (adenine-specific) n=1 Tax=Gordonia alkanivorans CGMCC 6845 TaxID=1423140 RepID=W9DB94_9ACTN|nr:class I SAM-dependent DNA methyltransferase [Gordonia alkanivorans]ETA05624.1 restriction endonuclease subunit M [Gordonia alkanivorans CGMCC 6845]MDH3024362.1 class I SAM-dependent DNA methyltransferase [Gordonia alkanivorans]MDH3050935.1 class I SAM-dependent DNA methyltransferase [Gordonia alkanivorans]